MHHIWGVIYAASRSFSVHRSTCRPEPPRPQGVYSINNTIPALAVWHNVQAGSIGHSFFRTASQLTQPESAPLCNTLFLIPHPSRDTAAVRETYDNCLVSGFPVDLEKMQLPMSPSNTTLPGRCNSARVKAAIRLLWSQCRYACPFLVIKFTAILTRFHGLYVPSSIWGSRHIFTITAWNKSIPKAAPVLCNGMTARRKCATRT